MKNLLSEHLFLFCAATWLPTILTSALLWPDRRSQTACQQLITEYSSLVALPNSTTYNQENIGKQVKPRKQRLPSDRIVLTQSRILGHGSNPIPLLHLHTPDFPRNRRRSQNLGRNPNPICGPQWRPHAYPRGIGDQRRCLDRLR